MSNNITFFCKIDIYIIYCIDYIDIYIYIYIYIYIRGDIPDYKLCHFFIHL